MPDVMFVMATEQEYGPELRRRIAPVMVGVGPIEAAIGITIALQRRADADDLPSLVVSLGSAGSRRLAALIDLIPATLPGSPEPN